MNEVDINPSVKAMFTGASCDPAHRNPGWNRLCWLGIVLGYVWRVMHIWRHNPTAELWSDSARNWEFGGLGARTHPLVFMDPIGYQTFLAVVEKLTLGVPVLVFVVVAALSLVGPWLWYRFFRELLASKHLARAGWALVALLPSWVGIYSYFMMETLFIPLLGLALWMTWRCRRKKDTSSFLLMGVCWLLAGLTRSIAAPVAAVVVTVLWWQQSMKFSKAVALLAIIGATLAFLGYRSFVGTGIAAPLGVAYLNQCYVWSGRQEIRIDYVGGDGENYHYQFGSPISNEEPWSPISSWKNGRASSFEVHLALSDQTNGWRAALARARAEGWSWPQIAQENLIYLFFGRSWPDCAPDRWAEVATQWLRWIWAPLALAASLAIFFRRAELAGNATLVLLVLGTWFVVQGLVPLAVDEGRYRKPMEGVFLAAALLACDRPRGRAVRQMGGVPAVEDV